MCVVASLYNVADCTIHDVAQIFITHYTISKAKGPGRGGRAGMGFALPDLRETLRLVTQ